MNTTSSSDYSASCADFSFAGEFAAAKLGDLRLTRRAVLFADSSLRHPEASIPRMAGGASGAEGLYRFIANEEVTAEKLARPHYDQTVARCGNVGAVLVLHDTTTFGYGKDTKRRGMGETAGGGMGFMSHVSLAVLEGSRRPLGVLAHRAYVHVAKEESEANSSASRANRRSQTDSDNESLRWVEQALATGKQLSGVARVHVADREADDYKFFAELVAAGEQFVTRASSNRKLGDGADLHTKMDGMVAQMCREVYLSPRAPAPGAKQRKTHPPRQSRMAKLEMSAGTIELPRTSRAPRTASRALQLNFVLVQEVEVPQGCEAVVWRLVTTLPVATADDIARVVDIYRARWVIEEFFKALKTGCSFLDHQLESFDGLVKLLALLLPVAWKLLELRTLASTEPDAPATTVLTARQLRILRALHDKQHPKSPLAARPTVKQAMYAVARLGGHFKQNGDPGWQTLGRGLQRLLQAEQDALALQGLLRNQ